MNTGRVRAVCGLVVITLLTSMTFLSTAVPASADVTQNAPNNVAAPEGAWPPECTTDPDNWDCTTDTSGVVGQTSSDGTGDNLFVCADGQNAAVVTQTTTSGNNTVLCDQSATSNGPAGETEQTLAATQTNEGGTNTIEARQAATLDADEISVLNDVNQDSIQEITATQGNQSGANIFTGIDESEGEADLLQGVSQTGSLEANVEVVHNQTTRQLVDVDQSSTTGDQTIALRQLEDLSSDVVTAPGSSTGVASTQNQNTPDDGPDQDVNITMVSGTGLNDTTVNQKQELDQTATGATLVSAVQEQGAEGEPGVEPEDRPSPAIRMQWQGDSANSGSNADTTQLKDWNQEATPAPVVGTSTQDQNDELIVKKLGLTNFTNNVSQTAILRNGIGGERRCEMFQDVFSKTNGNGHQTCDQPQLVTTQEASGKHFTMKLKCDEKDSDTEGCGTQEVFEDQPPTCGINPATVLWSPNHEFVTVSPPTAADPEGGTLTASAPSVRQDEPVDGTGDGNTKPDARILQDGTLQVRSERSQNGDGRFYHISVTYTDPVGNETTCSSVVIVPKTESAQAPGDQGPLYDSFES